MAILRNDIERALDEIISQEEGMRFQGLAVVLGKRRWPELIARQRKKDFGLDAYASASLTGNVGRGLAASTTPKLSKVKGDAKTGKQNFPDLRMLLFVTPAKVGNTARKLWEAEVQNEFSIELHLIEREEVITQLLLPENVAMCSSFLGITVDKEPDVGTLLEKARRAAACVTQAWLSKLKGRPFIDLSTVRLEWDGEQTENRLSIEQIDQALMQSRRLVIEGPAGRGKSTTLIQLALRERPTGIALLIELPAWISSRQAVLDFVAGMPAFRAEALTAADLARIQQFEPLLLLLNGWNEIALTNSQEASVALAALERDFPSAGIVVASRTHHVVPPLPGAIRLQLQRLMRTQRTAYLTARLGARVEELRRRIEGDSSLDDLTLTPFVLSEVTTLFESGTKIPSTKFGILAEVLRLQEQQIEHANALQLSPVFGQQTAYQIALGTEMTGRGAVVLSEADARALVTAVARRLLESGQIETVSAPYVLATLTAHHVLENLDYPERAFRFEHQQVQEFYAALNLRSQLRSLDFNDAVCTQRFLADYVNKPTWAEPLRMVAATFAEQTGDVKLDERNAQAGVCLVRTALIVDPLFAAELASHCGALVWQDIGTEVEERLRAIYAMGVGSFREYAIAAMLATGTDAFVDIIAPLLSASNQQVRLGAYRLWPEFKVSSLGRNWRNVIHGWTEEAREDFVSELLHQRVDADVAAFATEEKSGTVKKAAAVGLVWSGSEAELVRVVNSMDEKTFEEFAQKELEYLPPSIRPRAARAVRQRAESAPNAAARVQAASRLIELGEHGLEDFLMETILAVSSKDLLKKDFHFFRPALAQAHRIDAAKTSEWVAAMVAEGVIHDSANWSPYVTVMPEHLINDYQQRLGTENIGDRSIEGLVSVIAAGSNAKQAAKAFVRLRELRIQISSQPSQRHDHEAQLQRQLEKLFLRLPGDVAAAGILDSASVGNVLDILVTIDILSRVARQNVDRLEIFDHDLKARLRAYVITGVNLILQEDDFSGEQKAKLASAIAQVGQSEDFTDLVRIIRADIDRVRRGRAARAAGDRGPVSNGAIISYAEWNIAAAMNIDPTHAIELLTDLLTEPEYALSVTSAMSRAYATVQSTPLGRILNYQRMWDAREIRRPPTPEDARRVWFASSLKAEAARLIEKNGEGEPVGKVMRIAGSLAVIDGPGAASTIIDILALKENRYDYLRLDAAEHALMSGITLPTGMVSDFVDSLFAEKRNRLSDSERHLLSRVLAILPLGDDPEAGIAKMRKLLGVHQLQRFELREIIVALGHSRSDAASDLLAELALDTAVVEQYQDCLANALATLDTPRSRELLLGFIDPALGRNLATQRSHFEDVIVERLADLALRRPEDSRRLMKLCESDLPENSRNLLSSVMSRIGTPQALAANFNLIDDAKPLPVPQGVWDQLRETFQARKFQEADSSTYVVRSRSSNETRVQLFIMATGGDKKRQRSAMELLGHIEIWRLEEGKPADEPRHPNLDFGGLWPPT